MRYTNFQGLMPKLKPTALSTTHAQVAVNLDIGDGTLRGLRGPGLAQKLLDDSGNLMVGTPATIYRADDVWVGFPEHTFVAADTQGTINRGAFLFVKNQTLYWQRADRLVAKLAPVAVGVCAPESPPSASVLVGLGCVEADPDLACVTDPLAPGGVCLPETPIWRAYVYTWVRAYPGCDGREEESAPSPPVEVQCLDSDAPSLTCPALPAGVTSVRWYRSVVGTNGQLVLLFCGESASTAYVDMACAHALGQPLRTERHYPPPGCVSGVANLGDSTLLLWHGKTFWVSQPFMPYAYDIDRDEFNVGFDIVAVVGDTDRLEGRETYEAKVLTDGHPYVVVGQGGAVVAVREAAESHPCVSVQSVARHRDVVVYAGAYGLCAFDGQSVKVLTDPWLTSAQWRDLRPNDMRVSVWDGRVVMAFPDRNGLLLVLEGAYQPSLVHHTVRAHCMWTDADIDLHLAWQQPEVLRWGTGQPLRWEWVSDRVVHAGLWHPSAAKVVAEVTWQWHDVEAELLAYNEWKRTHPDHDKSLYFAANPGAMHLQAQIEGGYCHDVDVLSEGRPWYSRKVRNARAFRLPRKGRALEWAIRVAGYGTVREVHLQTSILDLAQDGGHG